MGPLAALAAPVRAVLDEALRGRSADGVDWDAWVPVIAERAGLDLRSVDVEVIYRRSLSDVPRIEVTLRDASDPDGDVEVIIAHPVWPLTRLRAAAMPGVSGG